MSRVVATNYQESVLANPKDLHDRRLFCEEAENGRQFAEKMAANLIAVALEQEEQLEQSLEMQPVSSSELEFV